MFQMIGFDMDGTIADTIPICIRAFQKGVSSYTSHALSETEIRRTFGLNDIGMIKALTPQNWEQAAQTFYREYELLHEERRDPFPGILDLLLFLKQEKVKIALITGKGERSCEISLEKLGISSLFDEVLCGSEIAPNKEEHMKNLLEKYTLSRKEFCYVGDAISDIEACRRVGITCLTAAWQDGADHAVLEKENPGHVFYRVEDLMKYLKRESTHTEGRRDL